MYAEKIGYVPGKPYNAQQSPSESVQMLSSVAKEIGTWLIGGANSSSNQVWSEPTQYFLGSIPEQDTQSDNKFYNTCTVYNPDGHNVCFEISDQDSYLST